MAEATTTARSVNNDVYHSLGERWYEADDDPVALLRALTRLHAPWIDERLPRGARVLDVGCGAGLLANELARRGFAVTGIDCAPAALEVAAQHDATRRATWVCGDARATPFADGTFDAVCAMDVLEHIEPVDVVVAEASRVLRPGGRFFFHTFVRSALSWLFVVKAVEWFVRNVPKDMHVHRMFVNPDELAASCATHGLRVADLLGCELKPSLAVAKLAVTGVVPKDLAFQFTRKPLTGYVGLAEKL